MNRTTQRMTFTIMLALVLWGIYLAIGATGFFLQSSMLDGRKSVIVVVCMALFLGLWATVIRNQQSRVKSHPEEDVATVTKSSPPWSMPGLATVAWAAGGAAFWRAAISAWQSGSLMSTTFYGWLAAFCILASATSGMIALSDPMPRRAKWLGLLGLLGFAGFLIGFIVRMTP